MRHGASLSVVWRSTQITLFADDAQLQLPFRPVDALHAYSEIQADLNYVSH